MFHKSKSPGQIGQWLRICVRCQTLYIGKSKSCPECDFGASYGAPWVFNGWLKPLFLYMIQSEIRRVVICTLILCVIVVIVL
jgi:hypothetical protein